jgi:hypothetical protein
MTKINKLTIKTLKEKRLEMLRDVPSEFKYEEAEGKKKRILIKAGKGSEAASLYFQHISDELARRNS